MDIITYIVIIAIVTAFSRFAPFLVFYKKVPNIVSILGVILPASLIAMIFVYSCQNIILHALQPEKIDICNAIGIIFTITIHKIFKNILLSIIGSTAFTVILQSSIL